MARIRNHGQFGCPRFNQATKIIARFGGESNLARILGINRTSVYRWNYRRPYGGDGLITSKMAARINEVARIEGILLRPEDWVAEKVAYEPTELARVGTAPRRRQLADMLE